MSVVIGFIGHFPPLHGLFAIDSYAEVTVQLISVLQGESAL